MICGSGGSKSRRAKAAGAEPSRQMRDEKIARCCGKKRGAKSRCTKHLSVEPLLEVDTSEKVHTVVAQSTFPSQNAKNTTCSDHLWTFRCRFAWGVL